MSHIAVLPILPSYSSLPLCCIPFPVRVGILQAHPCLTTCSCCHVDIMFGPWSASKTNHEQRWCCVSSVQGAKLCPQTPPWDVVGLFQQYQWAAFQQGQSIPMAFLTLPHMYSACCGGAADSEQNLISWKLLIHNHQQHTGNCRGAAAPLLGSSSLRIWVPWM